LASFSLVAEAAVRVMQVQPSTVELQLNRPVTVKITGTDLHLARVAEAFDGKQGVPAIAGAIRANPTQGEITLTLRAGAKPGTYGVRLTDGRRPIATVPMRVVVRASAPVKQLAPTAAQPTTPMTALPMQQAPTVKPAPTTAPKPATTTVMPTRPAQTKASTQKQVPTARMIPKAAFDDRVQRKLIVPAESKLVQQGVARAKQEASVARGKLNTQLRSRPDYLSMINRVPSPAQAGVRRLEDGNYLVNIRNKKGQMQSVVLMGRDFAVRQALVSAEQARSPKNQQQIYKTLHDAISQEVRRRRVPGTMLKDMPTLDRSGRILINKRPISSSELDGSIKNLVQRWLLTTPAPDPKPAGYPGSCDAEEGAGEGTDRTGTSSCTTPSGVGLLANTNWPLKYFTTCIKNQGRRGSCVAFSITAAVESRTAVQKNRWVNLSEQELYNAEKIHPASLPPNCGDGLTTPFELFGLFLSGHDFAWEQDWDYNPSYDRTDAPLFSSECYRDSCDNYSGGVCSNTNHQGQKVCSTYLGVTVCGYEDPVNGDTGLKIKTFTPIWNWFDVDGSLNEAKALLQAKVPVIVSFAVTTSFDEVSPDGYVSYNSGNESSRGNHAALLVGWIDNEDRPTGAPAGSGGGFFILKNSWGTCVGDVGYYYLPYDWVKKNTHSMDALNEVL
jgi:hypothetical protein